MSNQWSIQSNMLSNQSNQCSNQSNRWYNQSNRWSNQSNQWSKRFILFLYEIIQQKSFILELLDNWITGDIPPWLAIEIIQN